MLGLKDFSPQSQDQGAAYLANRTYKTATGRDLEADLNDPSKYGQIADALHSQWPSITSANIAAGFGGNAPTTQVAAATPAPQAPAATPTTPSINPQLQQLQQLQRLSLMSKLLQPQQQAPVPTNQQFPWVSAIQNSGRNQSNPLQTYSTIKQLQLLQNGGSGLGLASLNPLLNPS